MQLFTRVDPIYFPEADQTTVLRLGLHPLEPCQWLHVDADFPRFHAHKLQQQQVRPQSVYHTLPGSEAAIAELGSKILEHLRTCQQLHFSLDDERLTHRESGLQWPVAWQDLWQLSLWVQEDLCLLEDVDGSYRLTAASVCSPSNWDPASKIGGDLHAIHNPVPGYEAELGDRVDRLFRSLKPGKPLLRYNWSLQPGNELYWQGNSDAASYWRVERQTLSRLPQTGAIVFTIRIYLHPLAQLRADPRFAASLDQILAALPLAERQYKGLA